LRQGLSGQNFDVEPFLEAIFFGPDAAHFRACVTWDHIRSERVSYQLMANVVKCARGSTFSDLVGVAKAAGLPLGTRQFGDFLPQRSDNPLDYHLCDPLSRPNDDEV
jgi:hypothetical protein